MIRIFTRQIEKLGTEDGQALVFVALVGLVIFLFFSLTMNVADLVNTKIKNQNVADAAALSAAVWQARTLNLVSETNRNMLELWAMGLLAARQVCGPALLLAVFACGERAFDPIPCLVLLFIAGLGCSAAVSILAGALLAGQFEDQILDGMLQDYLLDGVNEGDMREVVRLNYAFKPHTAGYDIDDEIGVYMHYPVTPPDLVRSYTPGLEDTGDYVLERAGICETFIMMARYANYIYRVTGTGVTDQVWNDSVLPAIQEWYDPASGSCFQRPPDPDVPPWVLPLAIRPALADWTPQDVDALLAVTVATYKSQEPPPALGKGSGPGDCAWTEGDTQFTCPNIRHYAFASAHAYSESVSEFYNAQMAGLGTDFLLIPYISFEMDWEPRLFPVDGHGEGFNDVLAQIDPGDGSVIANNLLRLNDMVYFLY